MSWLWWLALGIIVGFNFGVALMALMQVSSWRKRQIARWATISGSPLEGPSTLS